jgi:hypothetical protein
MRERNTDEHGIPKSKVYEPMCLQDIVEHCFVSFEDNSLL